MTATNVHSAYETRVLGLLVSGPLTVGEIKQDTGWSESLVRSVLVNLEDEGRVDRRTVPVPGKRGRPLQVYLASPKGMR